MASLWAMFTHRLEIVRTQTPHITPKHIQQLPQYAPKVVLLRTWNASHIKLRADVILRDDLALALVGNQARCDRCIHHLNNNVRVALQVHLENLTGIHRVNVVHVANTASDGGSLAIPKERQCVDQPIRCLECSRAITVGLELLADDLREFFELEVSLVNNKTLAGSLGQGHCEKVGAGHFQYRHGAKGDVGQGREETHRNLTKQVNYFHLEMYKCQALPFCYSL